MAVLIRDMEIPKNCGECSFLYEGVFDGKIYPCVCHAKGFPVKPSETDMRDGLCPLVEIKRPKYNAKLLEDSSFEM
jgi:hypothetical protein